MHFLKKDHLDLIKNGFHNMSNFKNWISALRLRTLPLSVSGSVVGSSYAYYLGFFDFLIFILIILTTISFQILSNLANDYGDGIKGTDNKNRIGPERAIQSGLISPKEMLYAVFFNALISTVFCISLIWLVFGVDHILMSVLFLILGGISIYAAITYTMGKSAYGYKALGDLMVFLFFGLLSVFGTFFLFAKYIDFRLIFPASSIGLLSAAVLNLNNMRDLSSDRESNKKTLAVFMGVKYSKIYHYAIIILAIILMISFQYIMSFSSVIMLSWIAFLPLLFHLKAIYKIENPKRYDPHLKLVALSTFVMSLLFASVLVIEQLHKFNF